MPVGGTQLRSADTPHRRPAAHSWAHLPAPRNTQEGSCGDLRPDGLGMASGHRHCLERGVTPTPASATCWLSSPG